VDARQRLPVRYHAPGDGDRLDVPPVRVLIIADDPLARSGLAVLLDGLPGCEVVGQVGVDAFDDLDLYAPDVVVWDLGWAASAASLDDFPAAGEDLPPIIALIPPGETTFWPGAARGLLPRDVGASTLGAAIAAAAAGLTVTHPDLASSLIPAAPADLAPPAEDLTPRELDVLALLAEGLSNRAIARRLDISEHTVKFHVNGILTKLDARSRTEAVVRATRLGLILL
jgi:two-component system nitrate/nitrite response regulator NarL